MTPKSDDGLTTPGRSSVRDKLNINREEAFMDENDSELAIRQQQVNEVAAILLLSFLSNKKCVLQLNVSGAFPG